MINQIGKLWTGKESENRLLKIFIIFLVASLLLSRVFISVLHLFFFFFLFLCVYIHTNVWLDSPSILF